MEGIGLIFSFPFLIISALQQRLLLGGDDSGPLPPVGFEQPELFVGTLGSSTLHHFGLETAV